jgi:nitroreductase
MTIIEAMQNRHSVRRYTEQRVGDDMLSALIAEVNECNAESGLNIQLVANDPETFNSLFAKVNFSGAKNFFVLVGKEDETLEEKAGYWGERLVLKAQQLGLNSCWGASFSGKKFAAQLAKDEKIVMIISFGYGKTQGVPHKGKPMESLCKVSGEMPAWFRAGMEAAMLAPTAKNQQKFLFTLSSDTVKAESLGGSFTKIDLGIVKYHFETGAGSENFKWQ